MFQFGSADAPNFLPDGDSQTWISERLTRLSAQLGAADRTPQLISAPAGIPADLDDFFEMICGLQEEVGQGDLEFTLLEVDQRAPELPKEYATLGDPSGQMMHTAFGRGEYVILFAPTLFKQRELFLGCLARELGRMSIHQHGGHQDLEPKDYEADAELAAVLLGMGVWVTNGSYIFENSCCGGGGCSVDLKSVRTGLSMPEACYATALDGQRKGMGRRAIAKHLEPTQKSAFKLSWKQISKTPTAALGAAPTQAALS